MKYDLKDKNTREDLENLLLGLQELADENDVDNDFTSMLDYLGLHQYLPVQVNAIVKVCMRINTSASGNPITDVAKTFDNGHLVVTVTHSFRRESGACRCDTVDKPGTAMAARAEVWGKVQDAPAFKDSLLYGVTAFEEDVTVGCTHRECVNL